MNNIFLIWVNFFSISLFLTLSRTFIYIFCPRQLWINSVNSLPLTVNSISNFHIKLVPEPILHTSWWFRTMNSMPFCIYWNALYDLLCSKFPRNISAIPFQRRKCDRSILRDIWSDQHINEIEFCFFYYAPQVTLLYFVYFHSFFSFSHFFRKFLFGKFLSLNFFFRKFLFGIFFFLIQKISKCLNDINFVNSDLLDNEGFLITFSRFVRPVVHIIIWFRYYWILLVNFLFHSFVLL